MSFKLQLAIIILFAILNIASYIFTFPKSFALNHQDVYSIISMFNDFIFFVFFVAFIKSFRKSALKSSIVYLSIPLIYTLILIWIFR